MLPNRTTLVVLYRLTRPPNYTDIVWRVVLWGAPALVATLAMSWLIRRLKSRRENGPPVG